MAPASSLGDVDSGGPPPAWLLPEPIKLNDLPTYTMLLLTPLLIFRFALSSRADSSRQRVRLWNKPTQGEHRTFVSSHSDHSRSFTSLCSSSVR